jgi:hypothetical protein
LAPAPAVAGAWIAPEGGQEILSSVAGEREGVSFYETSAYWEVPVREETSLIVSPWYEQNYDTEEGWRAEAIVGVKQAVFRDEAFAVALSAAALWDSDPDPECSEGGAEIRAAIGSSLSEGRIFANVEMAGRTLEGGCASVRAEVSTGYRSGERWLTLGQVFLDHSSNDDDAIQGQVSLVRFSDSGSGVQVGVRARLDGAQDEFALVLGFWGRPGQASDLL